MIDKLCIRTQQFNFLFLIQGEFKNQCGGGMQFTNTRAKTQPAHRFVTLTTSFFSVGQGHPHHIHTVCTCVPFSPQRILSSIRYWRLQIRLCAASATVVGAVGPAPVSSQGDRALTACHLVRGTAATTLTPLQVVQLPQPPQLTTEISHHHPQLQIRRMQ